MYNISQYIGTTALIQWRLDVLMELTGEEATTLCIITPPHYRASQELRPLTFDFKGKRLRGNVDIKVCMRTSQRGFTALIKVAARRIRLAVSTFAGPAERRGAEGSLTRGREGGRAG